MGDFVWKSSKVISSLKIPFLKKKIPGDYQELDSADCMLSDAQTQWEPFQCFTEEGCW